MKNQIKNPHQHLIEACKRGDRSAQFKIYKLYYKAMYNTCLRIVNNTAEAEDIMQDSFLEAFRKLNTYTAQGTFGSWLKRITINNSLDFLRKKQEFTSLEEQPVDLVKEEEAEEEEIIQWKVQEIKKALGQLPEDYRVILSLVLLEGFDHEEICEILHISYNNSRTRYSRARQRLLAIIRENRLLQKITYN